MIKRNHRRIHLSENDIVSVCVDGTTELRVMLSEDGDWILVEEIAINRGIDSSERARKQFKRYYEIYGDL